MRITAALLTLVFFPVVSHAADCLVPATGWQPGDRAVGAVLPGVLRGVVQWRAHFPKFRIPDVKDWARVESVVGDVDYLICANITPGMRIAADRSRIARGYSGFLALTESSVVFISDAVNSWTSRPKNDVVFDPTYEELNEFTAPSEGVPSDLAIIDIGNASTGAVIVFSRGGNGEALLSELRRRIVAACGMPRYETANRILCN